MKTVQQMSKSSTTAYNLRNHCVNLAPCEEPRNFFPEIWALSYWQCHQKVNKSGEGFLLMLKHLEAEHNDKHTDTNH